MDTKITAVKKLLKTSSFLALILFISSSFLQAQITSNTSSRDNSKTEQAKQAELRIRQVLERSGTKFNEGLNALVDNRRDLARESFDKSVEEFLLSDINVQTNENLRVCYNELIETVYRMEFPNAKEPVNIKRLSTMCQWGIKDEMANEVAKLIIAKPIPISTEGETTENIESDEETVAVETDTEKDDELPVGFSSQEFEASPLDELSKLELTADEEDIESTPEKRQEYEVIRVAAEKRTSFGFSFQMHPMVQQFINYYRGRGRRTMEVGLYRSGYFMTMARRIFREEGVPENVAWLGQVESAWKPTAQSWAAAAGLWQFIPGTGARYGLRRTAYVDERNSFEKATRASARYLKFLANRYGGNWELGMAGYNCGEGNVDKAIRRAGVSNFWAAYPYLPRETRNYVPNILATIIIANNPQQYGFGHVRPAPRLKYDRVRVPSMTSLNLLAQSSDTTVQYLRYLNPELRANSTPPEPYVVRVPAGKGNDVVAILRRGVSLPDDNNRLAKSSQGETWENISRKTGVSVADLKKANPGMKTPKGKVYFPVKAGSVADNGVTATTYSRPTTVQPTMTVAGIKVVKAKAGDTVEKLAKRYGIAATDVAKLNGLFVSSKLAAGREIRIPVKVAE